MLKTFLVQISKSVFNKNIEEEFGPGINWEGIIITRNKKFIIPLLIMLLAATVHKATLVLFPLLMVAFLLMKGRGDLQAFGKARCILPMVRAMKERGKMVYQMVKGPIHQL